MNLIDFNSDFFQNLPDGTELISRLDSISNSENEPISTIPFGCEIDINELFERAKSSVRFIKKEGIEVANNARTQLTSEMIKQFDKIIVIAEPEIILEYLKNNHKVEFWNIENPKNINDYGYKNIISQIKDKVRTLLLSH